MPIGLWLISGLTFVLVAMLASWVGRTTRRADTEHHLKGATLRAAPLLVNLAERSAWDFLNRSDIGQAHVFAKVRLEDVVTVKAADHRAWSSIRGRIKSRHLDFVLTDADFLPILAVEVDGGSHNTERAAATDEMKNQVLSSAGVPLLRLRVGADWHQALEQWRRAQAESLVGTGKVRSHERS